MSELNTMRLKPLLSHFSWIYIICNIVIATTGYLLDEYTNREIPRITNALVPFSVSIYGTSQLFVKTYLRTISPDERTELAKKSTLVVLIINSILALTLLVVGLSMGIISPQMINEFIVDNPIMIGMMGLIILLLLIFNYIFAWLLYRPLIETILKQTKQV